MQINNFDTSSQGTSQGFRIIRAVEVRRKLGVAPSTLFAMVAAGKFPKPFVIFPGGRAVGWREQEIDAWLENRNRVAKKGA